MLFERNQTLILGEPTAERLQLRVQGPSESDIAGATENLLKVSIELKHVAEVFGTRKPQTAISIR